MNKEKPYIVIERVVKSREFNPNYGDNRTCRCEHIYCRHSDPFENMDPVGCKYCPCHDFVEVNEYDNDA